MNNYILILKGSNKEIATLEFQTLWETYFNEKIILSQIKNVIYKFKSKNKIESTHQILKRLTYTNLLGLDLGYFKDLEEFSKKIPNLVEYENKTFLVRAKKSRRNYKIKIPERELAKPIWDNLKNPKVDIENPDIEFNFVFIEEKEGFNFVVKIYENEKDYLRRMPKERPIAMPYTLKSDMARASINLLKLKQGLILDPFCGIGGILLEAKDMDFDIIGNDISWNDLNHFKTNFDFYYPNSNYIRTLADSQTQFLKENTIDGIVTDIPYGKCSRKLGTDLYDNFLKSAKEYLKPNKRMIVIYSNHVSYFKPLALKYFTQISEISEYINKDMTRYILILENNK